MKITNLTNTILWTAFLVLLVFGYVNFTGRYFELKTNQLKQKAVTDCLANTGTYTYTDPKTGVTSTAPQKEYYRYCLSDQGYDSVWK